MRSETRCQFFRFPSAHSNKQVVWSAWPYQIRINNVVRFVSYVLLYQVLIRLPFPHKDYRMSFVDCWVSNCYITYPTVDCCMHTTYSHTPHSIKLLLHPECMQLPRWLLFVVYVLQSHLSRLTLRQALHLSCACVGVRDAQYYHCCSIAVSSYAISF